MSAAVQDRPVRPETCQMFETPLIERFSAHPPGDALSLLAAGAGLRRLPRAGRHDGGASAGGVAVPAFVGLVLLGAFLWTFTEYTLHRWLFHYSGPRPWQRRMFFVLHGVHHDFPQDSDRLVMPLGASIPLGVAFYALFRLVLGTTWSAPLFVGFGLGYLAYDGAHFAVHHFRMGSRLGKWMKRYHMIHHHTGASARYGVSSPLWDLGLRHPRRRAEAGLAPRAGPPGPFVRPSPPRRSM